MLIMLSLYSSILGLALWQENQGKAFPEFGQRKRTES